MILNCWKYSYNNLYLNDIIGWRIIRTEILGAAHTGEVMRHIYTSSNLNDLEFKSLWVEIVVDGEIDVAAPLSPSSTFALIQFSLIGNLLKCHLIIYLYFKCTLEQHWGCDWVPKAQLQKTTSKLYFDVNVKSAKKSSILNWFKCKKC